MFKKRLLVCFAVVCICLGFVLASFSASADSWEDQFLQPPGDMKIIYNLSFDDPSVTDTGLSQIPYECIPLIPLNSKVTFPLDGVFQEYPTISVEDDLRTMEFHRNFGFQNLVSDYDIVSNSGSVRGTLQQQLFYIFTQVGDGTYDVFCDSIEYSFGDFYAFSKESFDIVDSDQNSQVMLSFRGQVYKNLFLADQSTVSFKYAAVTDSGLSDFVAYHSSVSDFAFDDTSSDRLRIDPGQLIKSSGSGNVEFFLIRDFTIRMVPNPNYGVQNFTQIFGDPLKFESYAGAYGFDFSFVYYEPFNDPSFYMPEPQMELQDYTDWITTAVSGFFEIQIFPGFYLSGFLMVVIAFACVIWFLKIFAGG